MHLVRDVTVESEMDIVRAREMGRSLALSLGFSPSEAVLIATAVSELSRNILLYAQSGEISLLPVTRAGRSGVRVVAEDEGPGIPNIQEAMRAGYSTSSRDGIGLGVIARAMDSFHLESTAGRGTRVSAEKWAPLGAVPAEGGASPARPRFAMAA